MTLAVMGLAERTARTARVYSIGGAPPVRLLRTILRELVGTLRDLLRNFLGWLLAAVVAGLIVGLVLVGLWWVTR